MTPVIIAVLTVFVFFMLWNIVMMLDIKQLEAKLDEVKTNIWYHVNNNKQEADAKQFTTETNSDYLYTEANKIRADYNKSVTNITALAKKLGYEWAVTANGKVCPGYWAKIGTNKAKPYVYADMTTDREHWNAKELARAYELDKKRSHSKKKVTA